MPVSTLITQLEDAILRLGPLPVAPSPSPARGPKAPTAAVLTVVHGREPSALAATSSHHHGPARSESALAALRTSPVPVLYAPEYERPSAGPLRIFAPIDFMRGTEPVLRWVHDLAVLLAAEVILGTVVKPPRASGEREALHDDAARALAVHARNAGFEADLIGVRVLESDRVADPLLEQARLDGCDLIIMASHGKDAIARFFVGSTTENVLRHADRPVLVLRRPHR